MTLLRTVCGILDGTRTPYALIGATAMGIHGVGRFTADIDMLATEPRCLEPAFWAALGSDQSADIRRGDFDDPLAGVVRFPVKTGRSVDLIVGRYAWQAEIIDRAVPAPVEDQMALPVASPSDLILLKLFAGGPQDLWDIAQLLGRSDRAELIARVSFGVPALPSEAAARWSELLGRGPR